MAGADVNCLLAVANFKLQFNHGRVGEGRGRLLSDPLSARLVNISLGENTPARVHFTP